MSEIESEASTLDRVLRALRPLAAFPYPFGSPFIGTERVATLLNWAAEVPGVRDRVTDRAVVAPPRSSPEIGTVRRVRMRWRDGVVSPRTAPDALAEMGDPQRVRSDRAHVIDLRDAGPHDGADVAPPADITEGVDRV